MAKAYKKNVTGEKQMYCRNCEDWYDTSGFEKKTFYQGSGDCWELDSEDWWTDYTYSTFWIHHECEYEAANADTEPDTRIESEVWVCGECGAEWQEQEDARNCCL